MATISVLDATGTTQTVEKPLAPGRAAAAASRPVVLANEDLAAINGIATALGQTLTVDGAVTVSGVATAANQSTGNTALAAIQAAVEGTVDVAAASLPLPSGAATETTLSGIATLLGGTLTVDGTVGISGTVPVSGTFWPATQPVSASALPLPSGAATSANQATANTALAAIEAAVEGTLTVDGSGVTQPVEVVGFADEVIAASQTDTVLGSTGAVGDILSHILVVPTNLNPGAVSYKDGSGAARTVFAGGTGSISSLHPFPIPIGKVASNGALSITTGANLSVIAFGSFT